jgi:phosphoglycerol geranylgeranyltransferase
MAKKSRKVDKLFKKIAKSGNKGIAWLVDPEKLEKLESLSDKFSWVKDSDLDLILVGGSYPSKENLESTISSLRRIAGKIPIVIFPGSGIQISMEADGILFLSLLSGRNPDFLIGQQIKAAPTLAESKLEVLPTAYILVNEGEIYSVHSLSQTVPLSNNRPELAVATALAGKFLGMEYFFLDAGSGAETPVASSVIEAVKKAVKKAVLVGGGIDSLEKMQVAYQAGADLVVVGNAIEKDPTFLAEVLDFKTWYNQLLNINQ